jgi:hypothetical protein
LPITGVHTLLYTPEDDALRDILRDVFGWHHVDAGDGWLIFALPPAEMGVHPSESPSHEVTFMCDDIEATVGELRAKGIDFEGEPKNQGFGVVVNMLLPGGLKVMLYQPRHPTAF